MYTHISIIRVCVVSDSFKAKQNKTTKVVKYVQTDAFCAWNDKQNDLSCVSQYILATEKCL